MTDQTIIESYLKYLEELYAKNDTWDYRWWANDDIRTAIPKLIEEIRRLRDESVRS